MKNLKKIFLSFSFLFLVAITLGGAIWYYSVSYVENNITDYNPCRDRSFILNLFKTNWYWLVSDDSKDFSPEYILDNRASSRKPEHKGNLTIKVYSVGGSPVGFVAYHTKKLFEGFILFLAVEEKYRKMGYAKKLMDYALEDLKNRGMSVVRLVTRVINKPARNLYESMGFKDYWTDGTYIRFEKRLD